LQNRLPIKKDLMPENNTCDIARFVNFRISLTKMRWQRYSGRLLLWPNGFANMFQLLKVFVLLGTSALVSVCSNGYYVTLRATAAKTSTSIRRCINGRGQADKAARPCGCQESASTRTAWKKIWPRGSQATLRKAHACEAMASTDADLCHRRRRAHRAVGLDAIKAKINFARCGKAAC